MLFVQQVRGLWVYVIMRERVHMSSRYRSRETVGRYRDGRGRGRKTGRETMCI